MEGQEDVIQPWGEIKETDPETYQGIQSGFPAGRGGNKGVMGKKDASGGCKQ